MHSTTSPFNDMTLLAMPKALRNEPTQKVLVITCSYCSPDPTGSKYKQYCRQSLMQHKLFNHRTDLLAAIHLYILQCGNVPTSLEDDVYHL